MAKPKTNLIVEEDSIPNHLKVWTPAVPPTPVKEFIEAIQGVISVYHSIEKGHLSVWLNPCYDEAEIVAEIKEAIDGTTDY